MWGSHTDTRCPVIRHRSRLTRALTGRRCGKRSRLSRCLPVSEQKASSRRPPGSGIDIRSASLGFASCRWGCAHRALAKSSLLRWLRSARSGSRLITISGSCSTPLAALYVSRKRARKCHHDWALRLAMRPRLLHPRDGDRRQPYRRRTWQRFP